MKKLLIISVALLVGGYVFGQGHEILTIRFESNSYSISPEDEQNLNKIVDLCNSKEFNFLKIFGYTDTTGTSSYNDWLSKKRCYSVWNYINKKTKIDNEKFYMEWLGESKDVYDLHFEYAHPQERCVDIWVQFSKKN